MSAFVTLARGGPTCAHATNCSTASAGPSATSSTRPSGRFLAEPASPCRFASRSALARYHTPCTRPSTTIRRRTTSATGCEPTRVSPFDVLTVAVLAFIGVRIAGGTRIALSGNGRARVARIVRRLRFRHFVPAVPVLTVVVVAVVVLVQVPGLDFGWWTALGGVGNPVTGTT